MNLLKRHDSCSFIVIIDWSPWPSLSVCSFPCFQATQWEQEQYPSRAVKKTHPALLDFCHVLWEAVRYILPWMKKSCTASLLTACCLLQMWRAVPAMGWFLGSGHCFGFVSCQRGHWLCAVCRAHTGIHLSGNLNVGFFVADFSFLQQNIQILAHN